MGFLRLFTLDSLRAKIFWTLIGGVGLLAVGITVLGYSVGREHMRALLRNEVFSVASSAASELDQKLGVRKQAVLNTAEDLSMPEQDLEYFSSQLVKENPAMNSLFNAVVLFSADGKVLATNPRTEHSELDVSKFDFFIQTSRLMTVYVSKPILETLNQRPVVLITAPIFNINQKMVGMVGGTIDLQADSFLGEITQRKVGISGYLTVYSQSGHIVASPFPQEVLEANPSSEQLPMLYKAFNGWVGAAESRAPHGEAAILAMASLADADWVVSATLPLKEADEPIVQLGITSLMIGGFCLLLFLPLLHWVLVELLKPLVQMQAEAVAIRKGSANLLSEQGSRELREVAGVFNRLFSERQAIAANLREQRAFYRSLNEGAPVGIMVINQDLSFSYVNPEMERMVGYSEEALRKGDWVQMLVSDYPVEMVQTWRQTLLDGVDFEQMVRLRHSTGRSIWVQINARRILDEERLLGYMLVLRDITDRKQALDLLHAERRKALAILDSISNAVILTDESDHIQYINPPAEQWLGVRDAEAVGKNLFSLFELRLEGSDEPIALHDLHRILDSPESDLDLVPPNGERKPVQVVMTQVRDDESLVGHRVYVLYEDAERREKERQMSWEATHDGLTGLYNRRAFESRAINCLNEVHHSVSPCTLALVDLDYFKQVNDSGGHLVGDEMLKQVARILLSHVRNTDVVARLGGDEFAILLPGCNVQRAGDILESIRDAVQKYRLVTSSHEYRVSTSIGYTSFCVDDRDIEMVIKRADEGCYLSKAQGRNALNLVPGHLAA